MSAPGSPGLTMTTERPPAHHDTPYDTWHRQVHGHEDPAALRLETWHANALALARPTPDQDVVEVGCGVGDFAITLAPNARSMTAVDFSREAIAQATTKGRVQGSPARFLVGSAEALPLPDASCDVLYSCECLEHVPNPPLALREMFRVLRPGGRLVLTTENYSNFIALYWAWCAIRGVPYNSGEHVQPIDHFFVFWQVRRWMRETGFGPVRLLGTHHVFLLLPRMHPHTFVVDAFRSRTLGAVLRPLARHMAFTTVKPQ
jgi:SAM-dependent methyltransferase